MALEKVFKSNELKNWIKIFNKQLNLTLTKLNNDLPNVKNLGLAKNTVAAVSGLDLRLCMTKYARYICIYADEIKKKNLDYFLNNNFEDDLERYKSEANDSNDVNEFFNIDYFKGLFSSDEISDDYKDYIFNQLILFNTICLKVLELGYDGEEKTWKVKYNDRGVWEI